MAWYDEDDGIELWRRRGELYGGQRGELEEIRRAYQLAMRAEFGERLKDLSVAAIVRSRVKADAVVQERPDLELVVRAFEATYWSGLHQNFQDFMAGR